MEIVYVNFKTDVGDGVLGFCAGWVARMARRVDRVHLITLELGRANLPENVTVFSLGREKGYSKPRQFFRFYTHLLRLFMSRPIDAVFVHMAYRYVIYAWPVARLFGIPLAFFYAHKAVTPGLRAALRLARAAMSPDPFSLRIADPKIRRLGHGIDTDVFYPGSREPSPDTPFVIATVGRIAPAKDAASLIRAARRLKDKWNGRAFTLKFVGGPLLERDHAYLEEMKKLATTLDVANVIEWTGEIPFDNVAPYYRAIDLFVSTSVTGSIDKAVLEAMASGVPAITSNEAFGPVFGDLADRLTFSPGDVAGLAQKIDYFAGLAPDKRKDYAVRLREIVMKRHNVDTLVERIVNVLGSIAKRKRGCARPT